MQQVLLKADVLHVWELLYKFRLFSSKMNPINRFAYMYTLFRKDKMDEIVCKQTIILVWKIFITTNHLTGRQAGLCNP